MAGADFIKTSTGKEGVNATLPVTLVMLRMIRAYQERTGFKVGYKPAGGISTAKDVLNYQFLMKEELGRDWLEPALFRIGARSEEHTSELQSLMRISYAVFCLKKKNKTNKKYTHHSTPYKYQPNRY